MVTGAALASGSTVSITNSVINRNTARAPGGTVEGGAVRITPAASFTIARTLISQNTADAPGGTAQGWHLQPRHPEADGRRDYRRHRDGHHGSRRRHLQRQHRDRHPDKNLGRRQHRQRGRRDRRRPLQRGPLDHAQQQPGSAQQAQQLHAGDRDMHLISQPASAVIRARTRNECSELRLAPRDHRALVATTSARQLDRRGGHNEVRERMGTHERRVRRRQPDPRGVVTSGPAARLARSTCALAR